MGLRCPPDMRVKRAALIIGVGVGAAFALASVDRCGEWADEAMGMTSIVRAQGDLWVGTSDAVVELPNGVGLAGYGPLRTSTGTQAGSPIRARATVVTVGSQRFAMVELDVLLISEPLLEAVRRELPYPVWVVASHTHSGPAGFDPRLAAEVTAMGRYRPDVVAALAAAARQALMSAASALVRVTLRIGTASLAGHVRARSGSSVDERLTWARFSTADGGVAAEWLIASAHPTLVPRDSSLVDGDYPGRMASTLVVQGAAGNAASSLGDPQALADAMRQAPVAWSAPVDSLRLGLATVMMGLPRPAAPPMVPEPLKPMVTNVLCDGEPHAVEIQALELGPLRLIALPFETSHAAGLMVEAAAKATRVVTLTNGYHGYVEPVGVAERGEGEARTQYFAAELLQRLVAAVELAGRGAFTP